jgi:hypothetical protein
MVLIAILLSTAFLPKTTGGSSAIDSPYMQAKSAVGKPAGQAKVRPWSIDYRESGGIAGRHLAIVVSSDGGAWLPSRTPQAQHKTYRVSNERLAELEKQLKSLPLTGKPQSLPPETNFPDKLYVSLEVTRAGTKYPIANPPTELVTLLRRLHKELSDRAEDEKWQQAGPFKLGRVWQVTEEVRDGEGIFHGEQWNGTWSSQPDDKAFSAVWHNSKSNEEVRDTVVVDSAVRGKVKLHRSGSAIHYELTYAADHPENLSGYVSSCKQCWVRITIAY